MIVSIYKSTVFYVFVVLLFIFSVLAVLIFISFDSRLFKQIEQCNRINWEHEKFLSSNDKFLLKWTVVDDSIALMVIAKTTGWFGLGFLPKENMEGADMVVGWVKNANIYLKDGFVIDEFHSSVDHHQDYEVIDGKEDGTYTTMCFRRKLDTCDNDDAKILQGSLPVIWLLGKTDPEDTSIDSMKLNESETGSNRVDFLVLKYTDIPEESDVIELRMNNVLIPKDTESLYWCQIFKIPKFKRQPYYIGMKPLLNPIGKEVIHYISVFLCPITEEITEELRTEGIKGGRCNTEDSEIAWKLCRKSFVIWTMKNDELELYPPHVGYPFGSTEEPTYVMMNNYYYNPNKIPGIIDNSGMEIYYTTQPPPKEASTLLIGYMTNEILMIPPMLENFKIHAICDPACMNATFPPDGIHVFGVRHHAHSSGKKVRLRILRDGKELKPIGDEFFNYRYEHTIYLKDEVTIYPTDRLMVECEFNSMMKNYTTYGGVVPTDEKCEVYLYYYPPIQDLNSCWSGNLEEDIFRIFEITTDLTTDSIMSPLDLQNQTIQQYFHYYEFTHLEIENLRNVYLNSNQTSVCRSGNSSIIEGNNILTKPEAIPYKEEINC